MLTVTEPDQPFPFAADKEAVLQHGKTTPPLSEEYRQWLPEMLHSQEQDEQDEILYQESTKRHQESEQASLTTQDLSSFFQPVSVAPQGIAASSVHIPDSRVPGTAAPQLGPMSQLTHQFGQLSHSASSSYTASSAGSSLSIARQPPKQSYETYPPLPPPLPPVLLNKPPAVKQALPTLGSAKPPNSGPTGGVIRENPMPDVLKAMASSSGGYSAGAQGAPPPPPLTFPQSTANAMQRLNDAKKQSKDQSTHKPPNSRTNPQKAPRKDGYPQWFITAEDRLAMWEDHMDLPLEPDCEAFEIMVPKWGLGGKPMTAVIDLLHAELPTCLTVWFRPVQGDKNVSSMTLGFKKFVMDAGPTRREVLDLMRTFVTIKHWKNDSVSDSSTLWVGLRRYLEASEQKFYKHGATLPYPLEEVKQHREQTAFSRKLGLSERARDKNSGSRASAEELKGRVALRRRVEGVIIANPKACGSQLTKIFEQYQDEHKAWSAAEMVEAIVEQWKDHLPQEKQNQLCVPWKTQHMRDLTRPTVASGKVWASDSEEETSAAVQTQAVQTQAETPAQPAVDTPAESAAPTAAEQAAEPTVEASINEVETVVETSTEDAGTVVETSTEETPEPNLEVSAEEAETAVEISAEQMTEILASSEAPSAQS